MTEEKKYLSLLFVGAIVCLAVAFSLFGWQRDLDTGSYVEAINYIAGQGEIGDSVFRLIKPSALYLALVFRPIFGTEHALVAENIFFYLGAVYLMFKIADQIYKNKNLALLAAIFFMTAYSIIRWGLAALTDMSGWFFFLLSVYLSLRFLADRKNYLVWLNGLVSGAGLLFKEPGAMGALFFVSLLFLFQFSRREKIVNIIKFGVAFIAIVLPVSLLIYYKFHYSFYHWFIYNQEIRIRYTWKQSLIYTLENIFSLMFLAWFFVIRGIRQELIENNRERLKLLAAFILPSLSFIIWPFRLVRMMFIAGPLFCLLAGKGTEFTDLKKQRLAYGGAALAVAFNFLFPKLVNLSQLQDLLDKIF